MPNEKQGTIICKTVQEAAKCLIESSFAVYDVGDENISDTLKTANDEAYSFFKRQEEKDNHTKKLYQRIVNGNLYGYNEPSSAKQIFRAFFSRSQEPKPKQPWPTPEMETASIKLSNWIHRLLCDCWQEINRQQQMQSVNDHASTAKRRKTLYYDAAGFSDCPLDYYFYHGKDLAATNCSEHIDRGILIGVCLSPTTPGLEILSEEGRWTCPEEQLLSSNSRRWMMCILAGKQLEEHSKPSIQPCVHRVRNALGGERLSISYEIRLVEKNQIARGSNE